MTPKVVDSWGLSACGDIYTALHGMGIYFGLIGAPKQVTTQAKPNVVRFGVYEFASHRQELRKAGVRIRLEGQPLAILQMLLERPGELVTREELQKNLWPTDTFVDFEHSLNAAVKRLRAALNDSADQPRYVETLARRGYRFIAPLNAADAETGVVSSIVAPTPPVAQTPSIVRGRRVWLIAIAVFALAVGGWGWRQWRHRFAVPAVPVIRSLAVLPLTNLSGDPSQEYVADGMTEALIGRLATIQGLRVISRTSSMQFKGTRSSVPEIARKLNVRAVVEGSVIRSGDRIRITAQLIQGDTDVHLWSGTFDRELRDVLELQSEVAQSIARQIEMAVTGQQRGVVAARAVSPEVYESYLKGRFAMDKNTPVGFKEAIAHFQDAINREATFAPAYAGLAATYSALGLVFYGEPPGETRPKVLAAARKALELDADLVEARVALADVLQKDWHWAEAEAEYRRAIELSPSDAGAHSGFSTWLLCQGRTEEALASARRAQELDPLAFQGSQVGWILFQAHRYDEAIRELRSVLAVEPENPSALWYLGFALIGAERFDEAIATLEKAASLSDRSSAVLGVLVRAYARGGRRAEALRVLDELHRRRRRGYVPAAAFLNAYLGLGDKEEAFAWMERAAEERSNILQFLKVHPFFDLLRGDPRFAEFLRRANFPPEQAAKADP